MQALINEAKGSAVNSQTTPPHPPLQQQSQQQSQPSLQLQPSQGNFRDKGEFLRQNQERLASQLGQAQSQQVQQFFPGEVWDRSAVASPGTVSGAAGTSKEQLLKQCLALVNKLPQQFQQHPEVQTLVQSVSQSVPQVSGLQPTQSGQLQFASAISNPAAGTAALSVDNPTSTASLQQLAVISDMNAASARLSGLPPQTIAKLREALNAGVPPATLSKLFDDHVVHTDRGSSKTLEILRNAAAMTGLQGNSALALLKLPPVRPPSYFSGIKPSIKQELLPEDKQNLLLVSMFNADPSETESERLHKSLLTLSTDNSELSKLSRQLLLHSDKEKKKALRTITNPQDWRKAATALLRYASSTSPPIIPPSTIANYSLYVTKFVEDMTQWGANKCQKRMKLFVQLDDMLRVDWGSTLAPEEHLWDYMLHPFTQEHLRQPLAALQSEDIATIKARQVQPARSSALGGGVSAKVSDNVKAFGDKPFAFSLLKAGAKDEHLIASDGATPVCGQFNKKGCPNSNCQRSHHCAFCGSTDGHSLSDCPHRK
eukprot:COSAG01_NODE_98_length_26629_cov_56.866453_27_plen_542_part_00